MKPARAVLSLKQVWDTRDVGAEPLKVLQRIPSGGRADTFCLIGVNGVNQAFGYYEKRPKNLIIRTADKAKWYIWHPEVVPHWPAIIDQPHSRSVGPEYYLTNSIFRNIEDAQDKIQGKVVRLATEYPPILIEVEEGK